MIHSPQYHKNFKGAGSARPRVHVPDDKGYYTEEEAAKEGLKVVGRFRPRNGKTPPTVKISCNGEPFGSFEVSRESLGNSTYRFYALDVPIGKGCKVRGPNRSRILLGEFEIA